MSFIVIILFILSCHPVALADGISIQDLPGRFYDDLQREISMWDDLRTTYKDMHGEFFINGFRVWSYRTIPYDRKGLSTEKVYYEYADPFVFIFSRGNEGGKLSFKVWGYSRQWEESEFRIITSGGDSFTVTIGDDFVEEAGYRMSVYGPPVTISINVPKNARYIWVRSENPNILISDISLEDYVEEEPEKEEITLPSMESYITKDPVPEEDQLEAYDRGITYVNQKFNFSITSIDNWKQEADPEVLLLLREPETASALWITAHQIGEGVTLEQFIRAAETDMGYELVDSTDISTSKLEGRKRTYRYAGRNIIMKINMAYILAKDKVYVIVCGTMDSYHEEISKQFDWMLQTFTLLDTKKSGISNIDVPDLSHNGIVFASSFNERRDLTRRPGAVFIRGEEIHVYTEVSNFRAWRDDNEQIMTSLSATLRVYNEEEVIIYEDEQQLRTIYNKAEAVPRYVYFHFMIDTEPLTESGKFRVEMLMRDNISQQSVQAFGWFHISRM